MRDRQQLIKLDNILGLRAWGLILYGVLPSNLAVLGIVDIKIADTKYQLLLAPLLFASFLPVCITFLLVRNRHREWYLTDDYLNIRSAITTAVILVCAALVFGASGIIRGRYILTVSGDYLVGVAESLIFAVASLVVTSTLFIGLLTKGGDLPGLPSSSVTSLIGSIRGKLRQIQASPIWNGFDPAADVRVVESTKKTAEELKDVLAGTGVYPGHELVKKSLGQLSGSVACFIRAADEIRADGVSPILRKQRWEKYFADEKDLNGDRRAERMRISNEHTSLQYLKNLRVGGTDG